MGVPEASVESYLNKEVSKIGGLSFKWTGTRGALDRIIIMPSGKVWFIEVKSLNGRLSSHQRRFLEKLWKYNCNAHVIYGKVGVDEIIEEIKNATK